VRFSSVQASKGQSLLLAREKRAYFAVDLNCGIGSSSLNAEVKAFARLHRVGGANSSNCGLK
jgi:hypothetical protein